LLAENNFYNSAKLSMPCALAGEEEEEEGRVTRKELKFTLVRT
jgi:hypothetical protein